MRFRLCCTCGDDEKPKPSDNKDNRSQTVESKQTVLPEIKSEVITQQPKNVEQPIQLDRITEVSVEESSVQETKEEKPQPLNKEPVNNVPQPSPKPDPVPPKVEPKVEPKEDQKEDDIITLLKADTEIVFKDEQEKEWFYKYVSLIEANKAKQKQVPQSYTPATSVSQKSNINVETTIEGEKLTFSQIDPDIYRGNFKGSQFHIIKGNVLVHNDGSNVFTESDKQAIKTVYNRAMIGMQRGMKELQGGMSALNDQESWNLSSGSQINTNYIRRNGENAKMTFNAIGQGHFRSSYEGKEFTILNGRLLADESFDELDRQLIQQTYNNTLLGMQQGLLGMQQGMQGMQAMKMNAIGQDGTNITNVSVLGTTFAASEGQKSMAVAGTTKEEVAFAHVSKNLGTGRETLRKAHSLRNNKRRNLLQEGVMFKFQPSGTVTEDINNKKSPKEPQDLDDDIHGEKLTFEYWDEYIKSEDEKLEYNNRKRFETVGFDGPKLYPEWTY